MRWTGSQVTTEEAQAERCNVQCTWQKLIEIGNKKKKGFQYNSCYGKTLQTESNYTISQIVTSPEDFARCLGRDGRTILDFTILSEKSLEMKFEKNSHKIKAQKYIGSCALWVAKMIMLDFVYNCMWTVYTLLFNTPTLTASTCGLSVLMHQKATKILE